MPLTKEERENFEWLPKIEVKGNTKNNTQSGIVFFIIDLKSLFNIDLSYHGVKDVLNRAFNASKHAIPVDTGLTKKSYSQKQLDDYRVYYYFDPNKIIGQIRKGVKVKDYYVQYIAESAKNFNWISVLMKMFYDELFKGMKSLYKKHEEKKESSKRLMNLGYAMIFKEQIDQEYKVMKEKKKEEIDEQKRMQKLKYLLIKQKKEARKQKRLEAEDK